MRPTHGRKAITPSGSATAITPTPLLRAHVDEWPEWPAMYMYVHPDELAIHATVAVIPLRVSPPRLNPVKELFAMPTSNAAAVINVSELDAMLASSAPPRVLDVRTPGEFETVHIGGSYNVPLDLLREHRDDIARHLDEDVVLVCRSGQRAAQVRASSIPVMPPGMTTSDSMMSNRRRPSSATA